MVAAPARPGRWSRGDAPPAQLAATSEVVPFSEARAHCSTCHVRALCLPLGLDTEVLRHLDTAINLRMRVKRRGTLYRPGDRFTGLYAIRLGTFKTVVLAEDGREQVTGCHMAGEVLGLDGIGDQRFASEAIALEDSEVCVLQYAHLDRLSHEVPGLRHNLLRLASRDLVRNRAMMLLLGSRAADERLAIFLLDIAERYHARGYSAREFVLRMTREEIASYLGLKLETVSRLFSSLQESGLIHVQGRAVKLIDAARLRQLVGHQPPSF